MQLQSLELQSSKIFAFILIMMHAGALMGINLSVISIELKLLLSAFVIINAIFSFNKYILLSSPHAIIGISINNQGQWHLMTRNGEVLAAQLCGDTICSRWLVILNFTLEGLKKRCSCLIFPDSIESDHFRQLRVYLGIMSRKM